MLSGACYFQVDRQKDLVNTAGVLREVVDGDTRYFRGQGEGGQGRGKENRLKGVLCTYHGQ
jgi:hypothetical protein